MKHIVTSGIVLGRLNYGEADKIITVITPDHGKLRLMARGVRKSTSKLAGGIELFCISNITFIPGKRDINTLVSTRLVTHYNHIVEDITRTTAGYDIIKLLHKATEDECESDYYHVLMQSLTFLNEKTIDPAVTRSWFYVQLLTLLGHRPNLETSQGGKKLDPDSRFSFDFERMHFTAHVSGKYTANDIKLLRLFANENPQKLSVIKNIAAANQRIEPLLKQLIAESVR